MGNFLSGFALFMTRHAGSAPQRGAVRAASAAVPEASSPAARDSTASPTPQAAHDDAAPVQRVAAEDGEMPGGGEARTTCAGQLPLVPFVTRHESFAGPKSRASRTLNLQRASTSITVPSRAVAATRSHSTRQHDALPPTLILTETERVRLQIMQAQIRLQSIALYEGPIDGTLSPETVTGLRHFQTLKGLRPTGTLAAGTLSALGVRQIT